MDFKLLINRKIIDILIGDSKVYDDYTLPRMSGPKLCDLCTYFGLNKKYAWNDAPNQSRWEYMSDLLCFLDSRGKVPDLLTYLFKMERFDALTKLGNPQKVKTVHDSIIDGAINSINAILMIAEKELRCVSGTFAVVDLGQKIVFDTPKVKVITSQYIRELPERIKDDIESRDYDSVITKSRTLLEEVLIFIIEHLTHERYKSSGDLIKIYQETTDLLNMRQKSEWDKRVNELLGGLHKLISAISSMRNMNSDAHGAGSGRIQIKKREALLAAHSSMMIAEYLLSVYEKRD